MVEGYKLLQGTNVRYPTLAEIVPRHRAVVMRGRPTRVRGARQPATLKSAARGGISANFDLSLFALSREEVWMIDGLSRR